VVYVRVARPYCILHWNITYTGNCNVLDSGHVCNRDWMFLQTSGYKVWMREREQESYESLRSELLGIENLIM
jgi:hypothetical protein